MGISNASVGSIATSSASINITDNDLATWLVGGVGAAGAAAETIGKMAYSITRIGNLQQSATIDFSTGGGTATPGLDYVASYGTLTFAVGEAVKVVYVALTDDNIYDQESLGFSIANASVGSIATGTGLLTINDNEQTVSTFAVGAVQASTWEGAGFVLFTITRSGEVQGTQSVYFDTTAAGSANAGTDFTAATATAYTFVAGETVKVVKVAITQDTLAEANETITGRIGGASSGTISTATTNITILDDDGGTTGYDGNAAAPTFAVGTVQANTWEGAGFSLFTITRSGDVTGSQTVDFSTTGMGTATAGTDFTAVAATTYTFAAGETVKVVKVAITQDALAEANKTIQGRIANVVGGGTISTATTNITILDDDGGTTGYDGNATAPSFTVGAVQANTWEGAGFGLFSIIRNGDLTGSQTIDFSTTGVGTATAGSDFAAVTDTTYTFAAGEAVKVVKVAITQDTLAEANETIQGRIANVVGGGTISTATTNITILDDDGGATGYDGNATAPGFSISAVQSTVFEATGLIVYQVTRISDFTGTQTVNYSITGGTATAGADFTTPSGILTFAPGEVSKNFSLAMMDDTVWEGTESVIATIATPSAGTIGSATATINIIDTDAISDTAAADKNFILGTTNAANVGTFINALDGNDTFTLGSAAFAYAKLDGGVGNDTFTFANVMPFAQGAQFIGGAGVDQLSFGGAVNLNLANLSSSMVQGMERVNFNATAGTLSLSLQNVLDLTSANAVTNILRFDSSSAGTLNLQALGRTLNTPPADSSVIDVDGTAYTVMATTGTGAQNNALANDVVIGGRTYDVYQYNYNAQVMTMLIDTAITKTVI
jgi:F0F1-type ATP synthase assembly protein I